MFCTGDSGLSDLGEISEVVKRDVEDFVHSTMSLDLCAKVPEKKLLCQRAQPCALIMSSKERKPELG